MILPLLREVTIKAIETTLPKYCNLCERDCICRILELQKQGFGGNPQKEFARTSPITG
jgi:hypothetical protein